ncbi:hypothetical protein PTH_2254 [Pelotomaculum thermopropionicum SI]|uniref:Uncharacterized protein n=1 Tax=Pelotomaculum thermopropionicum (strain DSM 13744 / JCM 10971 / SI) TaxID=370438 RepID=A5D011_PELTS|nr:hypothetical protein PTH_2254 [Pelotomaculum thermopropionicum SI]
MDVGSHKLEDKGLYLFDALQTKATGKPELTGIQSELFSFFQMLLAAVIISAITMGLSPGIENLLETSKAFLSF